VARHGEVPAAQREDPGLGALSSGRERLHVRATVRPVAVEDLPQHLDAVSRAKVAAQPPPETERHRGIAGGRLTNS
jgi:hypothetical protein